MLVLLFRKSAVIPCVNRARRATRATGTSAATRPAKLAVHTADLDRPSIRAVLELVIGDFDPDGRFDMRNARTPHVWVSLLGGGGSGCVCARNPSPRVAVAGQDGRAIPETNFHLHAALAGVE